MISIIFVDIIVAAVMWWALAYTLADVAVKPELTAFVMTAIDVIVSVMTSIVCTDMLKDYQIMYMTIMTCLTFGWLMFIERDK